MSVHVVPSALAQGVTVKFLTNENVKRAVLLRSQFGDETFSRTQVYEWGNSFKEGQTKVGNMRRLHLLQGKLRPAFFGIIMASYP
jgi:hypothetical protein